ncbi:MAG: threonine-phosphate decarboxylase CobD [Rhodocyclaceae bacterium]|nr:threonine-phosphate decarboxylase CobD [Rhodocyclaceae bacterium]
MLEHGGRLREAAACWGIPLADWLDLSTGIAPWAYPVPSLPTEVWQRLPEEGDGLEAAAQDYYGAHHLVVLPGSQAAIQRLPTLVPPGRVAVFMPTYAEHPAAWHAFGHKLVPWDQPADYAVLCNPNNPTGHCFSRDELLDKARKVRLLVVDEAFMDATPEASLIGEGQPDNVVVLRSLGKFFGLAGARVGFAVADSTLLTRLADALGPWPVAHPARWVARHALVDKDWQATQRWRLAAASKRLALLLRNAGLTWNNPCPPDEWFHYSRVAIGHVSLGTPTGTAFFQTVITPNAAEIHEQLARQGILVRCFEESLRFGLPEDEAAWQRLTQATTQCPA